MTLVDATRLIAARLCERVPHAEAASGDEVQDHTKARIISHVVDRHGFSADSARFVVDQLTEAIQAKRLQRFGQLEIYLPGVHTARSGNPISVRGVEQYEVDMDVIAWRFDVLGAPA